MYQGWENLYIKASWFNSILIETKKQFGDLAAYLESQAKALNIKVNLKFTETYNQVENLKKRIEDAFNLVKEYVNDYNIEALLHLEHYVEKLLEEYNKLRGLGEYNIETFF